MAVFTAQKRRIRFNVPIRSAVKHSFVGKVPGFNSWS